MLFGLNPNQFNGPKRMSLPRRPGTMRAKSSTSCLTLMLRGLLGLSVLYILILVRYHTSVSSTSPSIRGAPHDLLDHSHFLVADVNGKQQTQSIQKSPPRTKSGAMSSASRSCQLRDYPPHRYYKKEDRPLPDFLSQTEYIYGQLPVLMAVGGGSPAIPTTKFCVNQSEWYKDADILPFADGTNPSILRLKNNPQLDPSSLGVLFDDEAHFLATICMTNSQCGWKDTPEQQAKFSISTQEEPSTVRTVLLVLNERFETIEETTIHTLIDAKFGRHFKPQRDSDGNFQYKTFALDDARLFTYQAQLWVSYREGPNYGYEKQVLNRVHLERSSSSLKATLKASEVETLCCGRNMALLDNVQSHKLQALTWVDPITVVDVELKQKSSMINTGRRLLQLHYSAFDHRRKKSSSDRDFPAVTQSREMSPRRQLSENKKSDFHGTNGFMVHLPNSNEYLGIGHFHRPPGRGENSFARFGHHYTHAFYTIPDQPPYFLKRLSPELLVPSFQYPNDAEVIQFWSGLERVDEATLALAYGINDCEGAGTYLDMGTVESLLREVPRGKEVVDLLAAPQIH